MLGVSVFSMKKGKKLLGRPPQVSSLEGAFLSDYFDPACTKRVLCQKYNISNATFYRYETQIAAPRVKIGLGTFLEFPKETLLQKISSDPMAHFELNLARLICQQLRIRGNLFFGENPLVASKTSLGQLDFSLASISWSELRSRTLDFSIPYIETLVPNGTIYKLKKRDVSVLKGKPVLGVVQDNIHHQYADQNFKAHFQIKTYKTYKSLCYGLMRNSIDFLFTFPGRIYEKPLDQMDFIPWSKNYSFDSYTGVIFPRSQGEWREPVNKALQLILEERLIDESAYLSPKLGD